MVTTPTVWKPRDQVNQTGTGSESDAAIIDIGLGRYVAVWTEAAGGPIAIDATYPGSDLVGQIFDAEGNTIGGEFRVNVSRYADDEQDVALAPRVGGGFAAVYEDTDANGTGIVIDYFDVNGNWVSGGDVTADLDDDTLANPAVAMNANGDYLITYEREDFDNPGRIDIVGVPISAAGVKGFEVQIFVSTDAKRNPDVAALSNGNFVVAWDDETSFDANDTTVVFQILAPGGSGVGSPGIVAGIADRLENDVHVAALAGGGFVVVWRDDEGDGAGNAGIKARVYNNDGDAHAAGTFSVNTTTAGNQLNPEVTALADGGFVVVWNDPSSGVIRGQRFDAIGDTVGSEFTENFSVEDNPVVAGLSDGRFIVGFEDVDNAPTDIDIHGTVFDPRTSPINGTASADVLTSRQDGATVNGLGGADTLLGQEQSDTLNGGTGADLMRGRGGDDTFIVDNAGDQAIEAFNEGTDTVQASVSFTLGDNVEKLTLTGGSNINGTGNGLANTILGNGGNNRIDGKGGADDTRGGGGNDTYVVDNAGDKAIETFNQGTDTVEASVSFTLGDNVENLTLTGGGNTNATGNGLGNTILGNGGNNRIDGKGGVDNMRGGGGDDTYVVDNTSDFIKENAGEGTDSVESSASYTLGANIENLTLTGSAVNAGGNSLANTLTGHNGVNRLDGFDGNDILYGLGGNDFLFGGNNNDELDGGAGADAMAGGAGDDAYYVDNAGDVVTENAGEGTDTVFSSVSFSLGENFENLVLAGSANINGIGNGVTNTLVGNAGRNTLDGGAGDDVIIGGAGKDKLLGKNGKDIFVFADALTKANADKLKDFKHKKDKIGLDEDIFAAVGRKVSKKEFVAGKKAGDKDDHLIQNKNKIYYDIDGKGGAKQVLIAKVDTGVQLDHKDFMVGDFVI